MSYELNHLREDERAMLLRCDSIQKQFDGAEVRMLLSRLSECRAQLQVEQGNCGKLEAKLATSEREKRKFAAKELRKAANAMWTSLSLPSGYTAVQDNVRGRASDYLKKRAAELEAE